ncbi:hypothetical protein [Streptomyces sp. NPDC048603]|uniref:hypothetical protein n=1 Tax=Streptomyces sp. NPDC048603 TaxID=3365577 RepID=UPI003721F60E
MFNGVARAAWRRPVVAAAVTVTVGAVGLVGTAVPEAAAATVVDCDAGDNLQNAINASFPGDSLVLRGVCSGNFVIDKNLSVVGRQGAGIEGLNGDALLVTGAVTVSLTNLFITHSSGTTGTGLHNSIGTVTVTRSTIFENDGANIGGGIANDSGTLNLIRSTVSGNTGVTFGGGIFNSSALNVTASTISDNGAAFGAGILNVVGGVMTLDRATISGNVSSSQGGGINNDNGGTATLNRSTVTGNTAVEGGGIFNRGALTLNRSTVTGNSGGDCVQESPGTGCPAP